VLVCQKDVKAEQGALRVMVPCLERAELKVMKQVGGSGTWSAPRRIDPDCSAPRVCSTSTPSVKKVINATEYRHVGRKLIYMGMWEKTEKSSGNVCYIGLLTKNKKK
jgi:hypothetical protein